MAQSNAQVNDLCGGAINIVSSSTCAVPTAGDIVSGITTYTNLGGSLGCGAANRDVWYSFTARSSNPTIVVTSAGATPLANPRVQLFSGACAGLTSVSCGTNTATTSTINASNLTVGNLYFARVYPNTSSNNGSFTVCITDPVAVIDYSKSYINVTKNSTGGTVTPGDILEIRATLVVKAGTVDSVAFLDTLKQGGGLALQPDSLAIRTNEGKIVSNAGAGEARFTSAKDADAGWVEVVPITLDSAIQIRPGKNANVFARSFVTNNSRPSFYGSTCILMATYRVKVYAGYDTKINFGGGALVLRDAATGIFTTVNFKRDSIMVYNSPGLCPNSIAATNSLGVETNGTFGTPSTGAPLARNRGTSAYVTGYTYDTFRSGNGPQDYYYGIANNTSANYSTINTWAKPDGSSPSKRVFTLWDIIGDHTGASNTAQGNKPCDTTQPVSATNPCGYMLVVNAAYRTDTAFQYAVTNLCPNTYYEISAWVRNICYKCGCDSSGRGASSVGYIPFATGDSSGVPPNLAFQINGTDYYTTGDVLYTGTNRAAPVDTTQAGSDSLNRWVQKGFVYQTGIAETSFTLTIRNNSPGGGGNDWALDDIGLKTCNPVQLINPASGYSGCASAMAVSFTDSVLAYFPNYKYVRWEKSCNNGSSWTTIKNDTLAYTAKISNDSLAKTIYSFLPVYADSGCIIRVKVATTSANLNNANCSVVASGNIPLNISNCTPLPISLINFYGTVIDQSAQLKWTVTKEFNNGYFIIEKSRDGNNFIAAGRVNALTTQGQTYKFTDPDILSGQAFYRIKAISGDGLLFKYTEIIVLSNYEKSVALLSAINPFKNEIKAEILTTRSGIIQADVVNIFGETVASKKIFVNKGNNKFEIENLSILSKGQYFLRLRFEDQIINKALIKG
ncbi:MAG: hypothetical protein HYR66_17810 [Sphingobacteriales bacterium]|nr:hypothetical protein [Sphingobacteriales bacterium]MBI3720506.1 hypothetical protein [Sphingobacteriales bacterium]